MDIKRVAVGLSGGVDSAVSALLLKRAGFDVVGVHLYCWPPKSEIEKDGITRAEWIKKNGCRADEDRTSALKTALEIGIPFKELDFSEEYNERVIKYFYEEYEAGRTPNPDVLCNSEIKFGLFLEWALENGFDYIATGHYAKLLPVSNLVDDSDQFQPSNKSSAMATDSSSSPAELAYLHSRPDFPLKRDQANRDCESSQAENLVTRLFVPKDKHKDQTYFLWKLTEKELKHVIFPLGDYLKSEVREIAKEANLGVAIKKDSQGICFVGNVEVREFLRRRLEEKPGEVVDTNGNVIGEHKGVAFYTIGERGGWNIDAKAQKKMMEGGVTKPLFIVDKIANLNRLIVGEKNEVMSKKIMVETVSFINHREGERLGEKDLFVRIRHGGELIKVCNRKGMTFELEKEVFGVASGQSAVFYSGEGECLGGGVIV